MHVHTVKGASDSSLTPQQLVEEARRIGLNGVNISEHDRLWDAREMERFRQDSGLFASRASAPAMLPPPTAWAASRPSSNSPWSTSATSLPSCGPHATTLPRVSSEAAWWPSARALRTSTPDCLPAAERDHLRSAGPGDHRP